MWNKRWAIAQLDSAVELENNLNKSLAFIKRAAANNCSLIAFPEFFLQRAEAETLRKTPAIDYQTALESLQKMAADIDLHILVGSVPYPTDQAQQTFYNRTIVFNNHGFKTATYDKIHLFSARFKNQPEISEKEMFTNGSKITVENIDGISCGLAICYDLRFPELFRKQSEGGAELFFLPANFTQISGCYHWKPLLQARAIENQAYIVAPAQTGHNRETGVVSYGHSMVVNPWGEIVCEAGTEEQLLIFQLSEEVLNRARQTICSLKDRRIY